MTRILMRSAMSQLDNPSAIDVVMNNQIGDNTGNMIFANSVMRTIMLEDTIIDTTTTNRRFTEEEIAHFNEMYDYFVIPLANAFRKSFQKELRHLTYLIQRLNMPCIVIGVGVQTTVNDKLHHQFEFDEDVKEFMNAVLEKSEMVGVRGEVTAAYLKNLGYVEEKDFTVIGCPSMYMFGENLPEMKQTELTPNSIVSMNRKIELKEDLHNYLVKCGKQLPNHTFVPQGIDDLRLLYLGKSISRDRFPKIPSTYPEHMNHEMLMDNKAIGFVNVPTWLEFLRGVDFSFGSRIHGNIVSVLAGTPCYIFVSDSRIKELAEYHNIPHMLAKDIKADTNIFDLYEKADYSQIQKGQKERFAHYIDFLDKNKLPHIYQNGCKSVPFDEKMNSLNVPGPIRPFSSITVEEQMERLMDYHDYVQEKHKELNQLNKKYQKLQQSHDALVNASEIQLAKRIVKRSIKRFVK